MPFISMLFSKAGAYAAMALAAILAVLAVLAGARQAGKNAQRVADAKKTLEAINERTQVDLDVAAGGDAERQRVRQQFSRD